MQLQFFIEITYSTHCSQMRGGISILIQLPYGPEGPVGTLSEVLRPRRSLRVAPSPQDASLKFSGRFRLPTNILCRPQHNCLTRDSIP
jgi:hypothetical protein